MREGRTKEIKEGRKGRRGEGGKEAKRHVGTLWSRAGRLPVCLSSRLSASLRACLLSLRACPSPSLCLWRWLLTLSVCALAGLQAAGCLRRRLSLG